MNLIVGNPEHWHRHLRDGGDRPIFVRAAARELSINDNPFTQFCDRASDEIERRVQSHRERLRSAFRWPLDFRFMRSIYRAQKAGKWRLPRFRRLGYRLLAAFNAQIDRWLFATEGNPALDLIALGFCAFVLLYVLAQILRAWG